MILKNILEGYDYELLKGDLNRDIVSIENDSRKIAEGSLFIAEQGYTVDGHEFIGKAIKKGAVAVVIDKDIDIEEDVIIIKVENSFDALAYFLSRFNDKPWNKLELIGITGTNGKTSTTYFLKSIFEANENKTGLIGTIGGLIGDEKYELKNTTPNALIINDVLNNMIDSDVEYTFMEVSSHALALERVKYMSFDIGVFTNLAKDHLDYHKTVEHYFQSKKRLFEMTKKFNIINIDDDFGKRIIEEVENNVKTITFGLKKNADIYASDIKHGLSYVEFTLNLPEEETRVKLNIPGGFSVYNALSAAACAYAYGIGIDVIKAGLESLEGVKGRFEVVPTETDYTVIIDFAHTAEGLEKVLEVIDEFVQGRKIVVFGAGGNRDKTKRPEMGETVARHADLSIVTSDNPRNEEPEQIIDDVLVGTKKIDGEYIKIVDRIDAIEYALDIAEKGDIILLAGKGHETYTIIGDKTIPCDERQIVLDYLKNK